MEECIKGFKIFEFPQNVRITNSLLSCYQSCKRKFYLSYILRLVPLVIEKPFLFGTHFHKALELFYSSKMEPQGIADMVVLNYFEDLEKFSTFLTPENYKDYERQAALLEGIVLGYSEYYASDIKAFKFKFAEKSFNFPLKIKAERAYEYGGKIDLGFQSSKSKENLIMENKSASFVDPGYLERLSVDSQISGYLIGADTFKFNPKSVIYNIVVKSRIKGKQGESDNDVKRRIIDAYLENGKELFVRQSIRRTSAELESFQEELIFKALDLDFNLSHTSEIGYFYRNQSNCRNPWGTCKFLGICSGKDGFCEKTAEIDFSVREGEEINPELVSESD